MSKAKAVPIGRPWRPLGGQTSRPAEKGGGGSMLQRLKEVGPIQDARGQMQKVSGHDRVIGSVPSFGMEMRHRYRHRVALLGVWMLGCPVDLLPILSLLLLLVLWLLFCLWLRLRLRYVAVVVVVVLWLWLWWWCWRWW